MSSYLSRLERMEAELDKTSGGGVIVVVADNLDEAAPLIAEERRRLGLRENDRRAPVVVLTRQDARL